MQYFAGTREFQIKEPTAVTIGKFDGLHRGHQKLLREVMRYREKGYKPAVFTFETAPGTLIRGKLQTMITTNEEREENLREAVKDREDIWSRFLHMPDSSSVRWKSLMLKV